MESLVMKPDFWSGRKVFITGHTGFKGSWLSLWLQTLDAVLTGYAFNPATTPNLFEQARIADGMNSIRGDILDLKSLTRAMQSSKAEIVFHFAAQPLVRYSYDHPVETYASNVMGSVHVLEAIRSVPTVKAVVMITTDKCYENREWIWGYREDDPLGGYDPYSSSKACSELVTSAYRSSFFNVDSYSSHGVALASVRAGNVIGGGDWTMGRLIPDIVRAFELGNSVSVRHPNAVRPWQHVLEPLRGYLMLGELLFSEGSAYAEAWNFGPNDEDSKPVRWIVEQMAAHWGVGANWHFDDGFHPHESTYLKLDISKAKSMLGWYPHICLNDALALVVDWSKKCQAGVDLRKFTEQQIITYQNLTLNT